MYALHRLHKENRKKKPRSVVCVIYLCPAGSTQHLVRVAEHDDALSPLRSRVMRQQWTRRRPRAYATTAIGSRRLLCRGSWCAHTTGFGTMPAVFVPGQCIPIAFHQLPLQFYGLYSSAINCDDAPLLHHRSTGPCLSRAYLASLYLGYLHPLDSNLSR